MVDLKAKNGASASGTVSWETVTRLMRERGYPDEEIAELVTAAEPRPITIKEAAEKYRLPVPNLRNWLSRGHLTRLDRVKGPGPGGLVLLNETELELLIVNPPKPGRPPIKHN